MKPANTAAPEGGREVPGCAATTPLEEYGHFWPMAATDVPWFEEAAPRVMLQ